MGRIYEEKSGGKVVSIRIILYNWNDRIWRVKRANRDCHARPADGIDAPCPIRTY